jgi:hypothetical protein
VREKETTRQAYIQGSNGGVGWRREVCGQVLGKGLQSLRKNMINIKSETKTHLKRDKNLVSVHAL